MSIEFISGVGPFPDHIVELMGDMSVAASAPLNWNVLAVDHKNLDECIEKLDMSLSAQARGGRVVGLTAPMTLDFRLNFASGFLLDSVPGWEEAMLLPLPDKRALFADPDERARLGELALARHPLRKFTHWARMVVFHAVAPENRDYVGRPIGEIAEELGKSPWDTICDIALADDLQTSFGHPTVEEPLETWEARVRVWRHPAAVIGASDAGAHLDMFVSANYTTTVLGEAVARRSLLSMEEAVHLLTRVPADLYGLTDRGTLAEGNYADLVVLDEQSVSSNPMVTRTDLPGGASRLYADANGIDHVLCNGVEIVRNGGFTASRPGVVLRSGTHTG